MEIKLTSSEYEYIKELVEKIAAFEELQKSVAELLNKETKYGKACDLVAAFRGGNIVVEDSSVGEESNDYTKSNHKDSNPVDKNVIELNSTIELELDEIYSELSKLDSFRETEETIELMVRVQDMLISRGHLTNELITTNKKTDSVKVKEIVDIFLEVRREYQNDNEVVEDFSYLSVAWYWLGLKSNIDKDTKQNKGRN